MNEIVSREEQDRQGLLRPPKGQLILPSPERQVHLPPAVTGHSTMLDVPNNAQLVSVVQTTERDRSAGYLMRTIPLSIGFAVVATLVAVTLAAEPFFSWSAFVIFWLTFVGAWMYGEYRHGKSSPNAAALEEIRRKWDNIDMNDARRWDAWEKATGIVIPEQARSWVDRHQTAIILWAVVSFAWMVVISLVLLGRGL